MAESISDTSSPIDTSFDNFFALFEQPVQFDLVQSSLDQRLRVLQKRYHPDNIASHTDDKVNAKRQSEQTSALINQAYQTLSSADSRAVYLLDMVDQAQTLEHSIADLGFLDDAMDLRIALDEAISAQDLTRLKSLHPQISKRLHTQSARFSNAYDEQDWQVAVDATQKLKFLVKLEADVIAGLDEVANDTHDDDDDLYV